MVQRGECAGLALKASQAFGVMCERLRQDLDRDVAIKLRVARTINLTHAARADQGANFIGAESSARGKCHYAPRTFYAIAPESRRSVCTALGPPRSGEHERRRRARTASRGRRREVTVPAARLLR